MRRKQQMNRAVCPFCTIELLTMIICATLTLSSIAQCEPARLEDSSKHASPKVYLNLGVEGRFGRFSGPIGDSLSSPLLLEFSIGIQRGKWRSDLAFGPGHAKTPSDTIYLGRGGVGVGYRVLRKGRFDCDLETAILWNIIYKKNSLDGSQVSNYDRSDNLGFGIATSVKYQINRSDVDCQSCKTQHAIFLNFAVEYWDVKEYGYGRGMGLIVSLGYKIGIPL